ncbi:hypothetical protein NB706_001237 [Xanthomonas sacchari]|nr:hypothetical protein [Xanthomonas sacchari]
MTLAKRMLSSWEVGNTMLRTLMATTELALSMSLDARMAAMLRLTMPSSRSRAWNRVSSPATTSAEDNRMRMPNAVASRAPTL